MTIEGNNDNGMFEDTYIYIICQCFALDLSYVYKKRTREKH